MDEIRLAGIEAWGRHGVLAHERELGQRFVVDLRLELDLAAAAASDDLGDTVDYAQVATTVRDIVAGPPCDLLEAVAGRVLDAVLAVDDRVRGATVTVHKPDAPVGVPVDDVSVTLHRAR